MDPDTCELCDIYAVYRRKSHDEHSSPDEYGTGDNFDPNSAHLCDLNAVYGGVSDDHDRSPDQYCARDHNYSDAAYLRDFDAIHGIQSYDDHSTANRRSAWHRYYSVAFKLYNDNTALSGSDVDYDDYPSEWVDSGDSHNPDPLPLFNHHRHLRWPRDYHDYCVTVSGRRTDR